ncbi:uncharacterized protein [Coffea arabica]|uniref:Uncharacterized protein isoform X2 n=1 Tax=Coffea arabica TaxID=13443 RepID=A0ABM4UG53_COFAR
MAKTKIPGHIKFGNPTAQALIQKRKESVENPPIKELNRLEEIARYYDSPEAKQAATDLTHYVCFLQTKNSREVENRSKMLKMLRKWTSWDNICRFFKRVW